MAQTVTFHSWLRAGLGASIPVAADADGVPPAAVAQVEAGVRLSGLDGAFSQALALRGPGDILRLEPGAIARTVPADGARDCAPNFFPYVDFADPGLPWLFTPARPSPQNRLMPWLALVAVQEGPGVALSAMTDPPVMRLSLAEGAGAKLPPLRQAHAWAHVQETPGRDGPVRVARLLCPARLRPQARYTLCLVPAFEVGRLAGLGRAGESPARLLAWEPETGALDLPVYHHWRITTGDTDFEALVRRLFPYPAGADLGLADLDLSRPEGGLNLEDLGLGPGAGKAARVSFAGALTAPAPQRRKWDQRHRAPFVAALDQLLAAEVQAPAAAAGYSALKDDPVIAPPRYGVWQAAPEAPGAPPPLWMQQANQDPAQRAVSGLGTRVLRQHQEEFMGRAWAQLAAHDRIDATLRQARVALSVGAAVHRRLGALETAALVQITTPLHGAVRADEDAAHSLARAFERRPDFPDAVFSAAFRKVAVRAARAAPPAVRPTVEAPSRAGGLTAAVSTLCLSGRSEGLADRFFALSRDVPDPPEVTVNGVALPRGGSAAHLAGRAQVPQAASGALARQPGMAVPRLAERTMARSRTLRAVAAPDLGDLRANLLAQTDPAQVVPRALNTRLQGLTPDMAPGFAIPRRVRVPVRFDEASYLRLMRHDPQMILPGADTIPENAVSVLATNPAFVDSYLLGLNHEMSREFAWRGFPARLDGTWFDRFWDYIGAPDARDIDPIADWPRTRPLGGGKAGPGQDAVILIKSALFRRFPDTQVSLAPAVWRAPDPAETRAMGRVDPGQPDPAPGLIRAADLSRRLWPMFHGRVGPQICFFGFDIDARDLPGVAEPGADAGWFVVFEQAVTAPQFGLDLPSGFSADRPPKRADQLHWGHFAASQAAFEALPWATASPLWKDRAIEGAYWGRTAAETARLAYQTPVRILFHASGLIAAGG